MDEVLRIGYIKNYINDRGFGFIQDVFSDNEYFFHFKVFKTPELETYQKKEKLYLFKIQNSSRQSGKKEISAILNLENNITFSDIVKIFGSFDEHYKFAFIKYYYKFINDELSLKRINNKLYILFSYLVNNNIGLIEYFNSTHTTLVNFYNDENYINNKIIRYVKYFKDDDDSLLKNKIINNKIELSNKDYFDIYANNIFSFKKILFILDKTVLEYIVTYLFNNYQNILDIDDFIIDYILKIYNDNEILSLIDNNDNKISILEGLFKSKNRFQDYLLYNMFEFLNEASRNKLISYHINNNIDLELLQNLLNKNYDDCKQILSNIFIKESLINHSICIFLIKHDFLLNIDQQYLSKLIKYLYDHNYSFTNEQFKYSINDFKYISLNNYLNLFYLFNNLTHENLAENINEYTKIFKNIEIIDLLKLPKCKGRTKIQKIENNLDVFYQKSTNNMPETDIRGIPISCEGRLATNVRDNIPPEYSKYWCRNKLCYEVVFNENSEIEFSKISGFVNKFNLKIKHIRCTKCLKLLKPINNSNYNYYYNNYFRCENSDCENFQNETESRDTINDKIIYIHHCNNSKCNNIIDSRFSVRCNNNWLICNKCSFCCNNKTLDSINNRRIAHNQQPLDFNTHQNYILLNGSDLDNDNTKYFCHKCGKELISSLEKYTVLFNWLKIQYDKDHNRNSNKFFNNYGVNKINKHWWTVSETENGQKLQNDFDKFKLFGFDIVDERLITGFKPTHEKYKPRFICENNCKGIKNQEDYKKLDEYYNETFISSHNDFKYF